MAKQKSFIAPSVSITRSKFLKNSQQKTSWKMGEIIPVFLEEVLPGQTSKMDVATLVRMSTPVAPIMDNIHMDLYAFYCPNRLLWSHWKEFMGENNVGAGIVSMPTYTIPTVDICDTTIGSGVPVGSIGDHLGLPYITSSAATNINISALPGRMYRLIYNEWFRDQNLQTPLVINLGDTADTADLTVYGSDPYIACKDHDYFTSALPWAQKGAAVQIPLGTLAPVYPDVVNLEDGDYSQRFDGAYRYANPLYSVNAGSDEINDIQSAAGKTISVQVSKDSQTLRGALGSAAPAYDWTHVPGNLVADLSRATAGTINELRFAFQYQKLLERDALYGTRYWEILKGHFGVDAPDASLQRPEFLGSKRIHINVDQVLQTTGTNQASPASNTLGATGAVSVSGDKGSLFTKSFVEHGYIMVVAVCRHDQTYGQGIDRSWSRTKRTDFYFPEFANLGAQEILNKEIYAIEGAGNLNDEVFGYTEAWNEYKVGISKCSGLMKPSNPNSLGYWTLSNNFGSLPTLGDTFIKQDRNAIARALQTGSTGPDFIGDFYFKETAVLPMPMYSIPGLADHH